MPPNSGVTTTSLGVSALGSHLCNPRVCIRSVPRKAEPRSSPCRSEHSSRLTPDLAKPTHTASIKRRLPRNQNQKTTTTTTPTDGRGPGLRSQKETRQRRMRWSAQSLQCVDRENIPGMNPPPPPRRSLVITGQQACDRMPLYSIRPCYGPSHVLADVGARGRDEVCREISSLCRWLVYSFSSHHRLGSVRCSGQVR